MGSIGEQLWHFYFANARIPERNSAVSLGGGVDWEMNRVVAFRIGNLEYSRVWMRDPNGESYANRLRMTMGVVLRID